MGGAGHGTLQRGGDWVLQRGITDSLQELLCFTGAALLCQLWRDTYHQACCVQLPHKQCDGVCKSWLCTSMHACIEAPAYPHSTIIYMHMHICIYGSSARNTVTMPSACKSAKGNNCTPALFHLHVLLSLPRWPFQSIFIVICLSSAKNQVHCPSRLSPATVLHWGLFHVPLGGSQLEYQLN